MNRNSSFVSPKWAMVLLAAAVLALGGCGRKGPLDLPPTGSQSSNVAPSADTDAQTAATPSVFNSTYGTNGAPAAPKGTKKSFVLDPILNSD